MLCVKMEKLLFIRGRNLDLVYLFLIMEEENTLKKHTAVIFCSIMMMKCHIHNNPFLTLVVNIITYFSPPVKNMINKALFDNYLAVNSCFLAFHLRSSSYDSTKIDYYHKTWRILAVDIEMRPPPPGVEVELEVEEGPEGAGPMGPYLKNL